MSSVKLTLGIVLIFVLGCLAGGLSVELYRQQERQGGPRRHATAAERVEFIMRRLTDDLGLSAGQAAGIRPMVEAGEKEVSRLKERIAPEIEGVHDRSFAAIRETLDPGQREKLDRIRERMREARRTVAERR